jgi:hypothetical protein
MIQAFQLIASSIDRGFKLLANSTAVYIFSNHQTHVLQDSNLIQQSTTNYLPNLDDFFTIPLQQTRTTLAATTIDQRDQQLNEFTTLKTPRRELATTHDTTPIINTQAKNKPDNYGLTPEIINDIFDDYVSAPHFSTLLVAKAYEDRRKILKVVLCTSVTKLTTTSRV